MRSPLPTGAQEGMELPQSSRYAPRDTGEPGTLERRIFLQVHRHVGPEQNLLKVGVPFQLRIAGRRIFLQVHRHNCSKQRASTPCFLFGLLECCILPQVRPHITARSRQSRSAGGRGN